MLNFDCLAFIFLHQKKRRRRFSCTSHFEAIYRYYTHSFNSIQPIDLKDCVCYHQYLYTAPEKKAILFDEIEILG